ncbi:hypothetical protein TOPH_07594 [Tolypocladium ophioglossoides CBS 100239]|uniref:Uncharacterized protein n=1 Tax=Tolypocladium ophioglossoides (strain CBS 100239) TaxID=1163406 RepID=A0A0L0N150_TOLOC|nr:hypothetical protein TOPH_07594 [Tolypocladium ophioglossoides CBS 100239]
MCSDTRNQRLWLPRPLLQSVALKEGSPEPASKIESGFTVGESSKQLRAALAQPRSPSPTPHLTAKPAFESQTNPLSAPLVQASFKSESPRPASVTGASATSGRA